MLHPVHQKSVLWNGWDIVWSIGICHSATSKIIRHKTRNRITVKTYSKHLKIWSMPSFWMQTTGWKQFWHTNVLGVHIFSTLKMGSFNGFPEIPLSIRKEKSYQTCLKFIYQTSILQFANDEGYITVRRLKGYKQTWWMLSSTFFNYSNKY